MPSWKKDSCAGVEKMSEPSLKPLATVQEGQRVKIKEIRSGRMLKKRLSELGLYEGTKVVVKKNSSFGPIILKVLDSTLVLGRGEAQKILVD